MDSLIYMALQREPPSHTSFHAPQIGRGPGRPLRKTVVSGPSRMTHTLTPLAAAVGLTLLITGCVCPRPPHAVDGTTNEEKLAADVRFLAQPALKGRAPHSLGSRAARLYIESRFQACGLVPWGHQKSYEVPFGAFYGLPLGRNIVGVLPGADTNQASELVLVSAHYDHLGKDSKGRICPGASDNASGVATLLEVARQMSLHQPRPNRSICFAAFDCEEMGLLGSFAFAGRKDVQATNVVAVVNVDMLGRDFLDVVPNTLFVAGTEPYPELRRNVCQMGTALDMKVVPVGTDLIGPRGDHAAFENRPIPCLFFSCGMFKDYHKPADTADKLNFAECDRSTRIILSTVRALTGQPGYQRTESTADTDAQELQAITAVMAQVDQHRAQAGISKPVADAFKELAAEAENARKSGCYTHSRRAEFAAGAVGVLAPSLLGLDGMEDQLDAQQRGFLAAFLPYLAEVYISQRAQIMEGYHELVAYMLKHPPGFFHRAPDFQYEICQVDEQDIHLAECSPGQYELNVLVLPMMLRVSNKDRVISISLQPECIDGQGTRDQLTDLCLLRLRQQQTNALHARFILQTLHKLNGTQPSACCQELLSQRLQQGGFKNEPDWLASCLGSGCPDLALEALGVESEDKDGNISQSICKLICDPATRPDVRAAAIKRAGRTATTPMLLALCSVVNDTSPAGENEFWRFLHDDYPFADRLAVKSIRPLVEAMRKTAPNNSKSIGALACAELKQATGKDFGNDSQKWQAWIQRRNTKNRS